MLQLIGKIFEDGTKLENEMHSMVAVDLLMALLEHQEGLQSQIDPINELYLNQLSAAKSTDYKNMLIQGLMMNLWYDQATTIQSLKQRGALEQVFTFIL